MRPNRHLLMIAATLICAPPLRAQTREHAKVDSLAAKGIRAEVDSIDNKSSRPAYQKRSEIRLKTIADSLDARASRLGTATTPSEPPHTDSNVVVVVVPPKDSSPVVTPPTTTPPVTDSLTQPIVVPVGVTLAERPRVRLDTRYPTDAFRVVGVGTDLQAALNAAVCGDVLQLPARSVYVGNFTLPVKTCVGPNPWVILRTGASLTPDNVRADSLTAVTTIGYASVRTPNQAPALVAPPGANHWRIVGVELTLASPALSVFTNGLLRLDRGSSFIYADRVYIHGSNTGTVHRCVTLNNTSSGVFDSEVSQCHGPDGDSQAIWGADGNGPYEIRNNKLSGGHEVVMFGGADPTDPSTVPADITIAGNLFTRTVTEVTPRRGETKTLLELKNGIRVDIVGNTFQYQAADAQEGYAFNWKSTNQNGTCPLCRVTDITFRGNIVQYTANGVSLAGAPQGPTTYPTARIVIVDNVFRSMNTTPPWVGEGIPMQVLGPVNDLVVARNKFPAGAATLWGLSKVELPGSQRAVWSDNTISCVGYGFKTSNYGPGLPSIAVALPGLTWTNNTVVGCNTVQYPPSWPAAGTVYTTTGPLQ